MAGQANSKMLFIAPANPATQLVQVAQTKVMRVIDDDCVYVRNVNTTFHDVGANKHVVLFFIDEIQDSFFQFMASNWPCAKPMLKSGKALYQCRHFGEAENAVMNKENLPPLSVS